MLSQRLLEDLLEFFIIKNAAISLGAEQDEFLEGRVEKLDNPFKVLFNLRLPHLDSLNLELEVHDFLGIVFLLADLLDQVR